MGSKSQDFGRVPFSLRVLEVVLGCEFIGKVILTSATVSG